MIEGDRSLFLRYDEVEWAWRIVDQLARRLGQRARLHTNPSGGAMGARGSEPGIFNRANTTVGATWWIRNEGGRGRMPPVAAAIGCTR